MGDAGLMAKKKINLTNWQLRKLKMSEQQIRHFEYLFDLYWKYVYEYEVGYMEHFNDKKKTDIDKEDFYEQLYNDGMYIKVNDGY